MEKAFGIWVYGTGPSLVGQIGQVDQYNQYISNQHVEARKYFSHLSDEEYNHRCADQGKIGYLYPYCLQVNFASGEVKVRPELEYFTYQTPDSCQFYPLIDGSLPQGAAPEKRKLERIITTLRETLLPYSYRMKGLHLDLEPALPEHATIYKQFRKKIAEPLNLPLSIAVGRRKDLTPLFQEVNHAVLMAYDCAEPGEPTPLPSSIYVERAKSRINHFVECIEKTSCHYSIGLPFAATSHEYEFVHGKQEERKQISMLEYVQPVYEWLMNQYSLNSKFTGITIWNLRNEKERHRKILPNGNTILLEPASIAKEGWEFLSEHRGDYFFKEAYSHG